MGAEQADKLVAEFDPKGVGDGMAALNARAQELKAMGRAPWQDEKYGWHPAEHDDDE